jgi:hypothetical protein
MAEIEFEIKGKGKKGDDNSLTEIKFTSIKIGNVEKKIENDSETDHGKAKEALSELLSKPAVEVGSSELNVRTDITQDGGSSHKRKSYKKEKKMKGGKRKSLRRNKHV